MILCDTGPLVATFNKADDDHERSPKAPARDTIPNLGLISFGAYHRQSGN
ncbi:MAG: hypothetical protein JWR24_3118 [Actinoallomurus sp.]|nr:hypothetical protein [Actinoallomurus sp.]